LNSPIELFWHELKDYVREKMCRNERELIDAIHEFARNVSLEKCQSYIRHLRTFVGLFKFYLKKLFQSYFKVIPRVIERQGGWSR
jgi:hypothetical protein